MPGEMEMPQIPHEPEYLKGETLRRWRSERKLAESGKRKGRPVKRVPHYGKCNERD